MEKLLFFLIKLENAFADKRLIEFILKQRFNKAYREKYYNLNKKIDEVMNIINGLYSYQEDRERPQIDRIFKELNENGISRLIDFIVMEALIIKNGNLNLSLKFRTISIDYLKINELNKIEKKYLLIENNKKKKNNQLDLSFFLSYIKNMNLQKHNRMNSLVKNKSVALIGPGFITKDEIGEISKFETLVTLNTLSLDSRFDELESNRADISYLNSITLKKFTDDNSETLGKRETYLVIKSVSKGSPRYLFQKKFKIAKSNHFFINGSPNLGLIAVWDLVHYNPARVKLFGFDFYTSKKKYQDPKYISKGMEFSYSTLSIHNPISNFKFINLLYSIGLIELTDTTKNIINLSEEEFMKLLTETNDMK